MSKLHPSLLKCSFNLLSLTKAPCRDLAHAAPLELGAQQYRLFQPKACHANAFVVLKSKLTDTPLQLYLWHTFVSIISRQLCIMRLDTPWDLPSSFMLLLHHISYIVNLCFVFWPRVLALPLLSLSSRCCCLLPLLFN